MGCSRPWEIQQQCLIPLLAMVPTTSSSASLMTRTLTFQGNILRSELDTTFENFNFRLLNSPDEIVWITVANVTDANRARHLELREKLFNIMLQSPYVKVVEFSLNKEGATTSIIRLLFC